MFRITVSKRLVLTWAVVATVAAMSGCSLAMFGVSPEDTNNSETPDAALTGTPGATATPEVAVIGVIDEIEGDHVVVEGQVYVLPASAIQSLEVGDTLIILIRYECDANVACSQGGGEQEENEGDDD